MRLARSKANMKGQPGVGQHPLVSPAQMRRDGQMRMMQSFDQQSDGEKLARLYKAVVPGRA